MCGLGPRPPDSGRRERAGRRESSAASSQGASFIRNIEWVRHSRGLELMGTQLTLSSTGVGRVARLHVGFSQPIPSRLRPRVSHLQSPNRRSAAALGGAVCAGPRPRPRARAAGGPCRALRGGQSVWGSQVMVGF